MAHLPNHPFLRTPDSRFVNLPDFPYAPKYIQYGNLRMAYIDESSPTNPSTSPEAKTEVFICLHGQPTWSYLYRHMIPVLLNYTTLSNLPNPRRVIAPDLFGFGRSDKPTNDSVYTYTFHRDSLIHFVTTLNLSNVTLVVQDWGGLLGLTLPHVFPHRIKRLLVMNTSIATGQPPTAGFLAWREYSNRTPDMNIGALMRRSCSHLTPAEAAAYDAPFPSVEFKGGVRRFPRLVMTEPDMEGVGVSKKALEFDASESSSFKGRDVFVACGVQDQVLGKEVMWDMARRVWRDGCFYADIGEAGHFVQEWGREVARLAIGVFEGVEGEGVRRVGGGQANI